MQQSIIDSIELFAEVNEDFRPDYIDIQLKCFGKKNQPFMLLGVVICALSLVLIYLQPSRTSTFN